MFSLSNRKFSFWFSIAFVTIPLVGMIFQFGLGFLPLVLTVVFLGSLMVSSFLAIFYWAEREAQKQSGSTEKTKFRDWLKEWLAKRFGEPPQAYWKIILWVCAALGGLFLVLSPFFSSPSFFTPLGSLSPDVISGTQPFLWFLPLPGVVAALVILKFTQTRSDIKGKQTILVVVFASLSACVMLAIQKFLLDLPAILELPLSGAVQVLSSSILTLLFLSISIWIASAQHPPIGIGLKLFLIGLIAGTALSFTLAYPTFTWLYQHYIPNDFAWDIRHERVLLFCWIISGVLALLVGPVTVLLTHPQKVLQKLWLGAISGSIAGGVIYGYLGGVASGVIAQSVLLPIAVTREGFGGDTWVFRLAIAVNDVFPTSIAATWVCIGAGLLLGGLTALLTPSLEIGNGKEPIPGFKQFLSELTWPGTILVEILTFIVIAASMQVLLGTLVPNILSVFGFTPGSPHGLA